MAVALHEKACVLLPETTLTAASNRVDFPPPPVSAHSRPNRKRCHGFAYIHHYTCTYLVHSTYASSIECSMVPEPPVFMQPYRRGYRIRRAPRLLVHAWRCCRVLYIHSASRYFYEIGSFFCVLAGAIPVNEGGDVLQLGRIGR